MRKQLIFGALAALACARALAASVDARIDAIYRELGRGEQVQAVAHSAALLDELPPGDRHRADALQLRLDVLDLHGDLSKPEGAALHELLQREAGHDARTRDIAQRCDLLSDLAAKKTQDVLTVTQALLAASAQHDSESIAELQSIRARAAALAKGHLDDVRSAAQAGLVYWRAQNGMRAASRQVLLTYMMANVYFYTGSKDEALAQFQAASKIAIAAFGADSAARIKVDTDRAATLAQLGRNSEAQALREDVLAATRRHYGERSVETAKSEAMVGAGLQEIGDYAAARAHYEHAEATLAAIGDDGNDAHAHERALISANFANLLQEMGEEQAALDHYRAALTVFGDDPQAARTRAIVLTNIGNTEFRMHDYDKAIADFTLALALRESVDGKNAPGLGFALEGLGSSALALRQYADAEKYFARALEVKGRGVPPNHPTLAPFNFGFALAHWGQGHSDEAFRYARTTAENQQALLATFASDFSERQSVSFRDILQPATALVVTLAAQRGDADSVTTAWRLAMVERGLVARAQTRRLAAARAAHDPKLAQAWAAWQHANSVLGEAWLATNTTPEHMQQLRSDAETAERALWLALGRDPGAAQKVADIADLQRALPKDGALIAYTEGVAEDSARLLAAGDKAMPEDWYAFTLGADAAPRLRRIGNIAALSAQVHAWYRGLRDPDSDLAALRRDGLALRRAVLDPFAPQARHLFVVPEGELYRVSFAALPDDKSGWLIESGAHVHTLAHESDLALPAPAPAAPSDALLAGAPDFAAATGNAVASRQLCLRATREGFAAIPNAARELDDLDTLLAANSTNAKIHIVRGAQATKQNVLAELPQANIVHLATHGFSLDESCAESAARGVSIATPASGNEASAPALSGLAFSGANVSAAPVGVLSAGELAALDLSRVDWIALSACDSGLGPIGRNEGVFGMRRALRLAGARTVVMSLWQVDDAATADLMAALYRARFVQHDAVPDAMASAMRNVIAARRAAHLSEHPYYWAAFIGEGGWR